MTTSSKKLSLPGADMTLERLLKVKRERLQTQMLSESELASLKDEMHRSLERMDAILDRQMSPWPRKP